MTKPDTAPDQRLTSDPGQPWIVTAVLLAVAVGLLLLFLPLFATSSDRGADGGNRQDPQVTAPADGQSRDGRSSLFQQGEWGAAAALALPVLICAAPLLAHRRRRVATVTAAVLLGAGVLVGAASVGLFYLPSAAVMIVAAIRGRDRVPAGAG